MRLFWAVITLTFFLAGSCLAEDAGKISEVMAGQMAERALRLEQEKEYEAAIVLWKRLHSAYPENTDYLFRLGRLYSWTHHWSEAEKYLLRCLELNPDHGDARLGLGYLYFWRGNLDVARNQFEKVREKQPDNLDALTALGRINWRTGDLQAAARAFQSVLQIEPDHVEALTYLGRIKQGQRRYGEAKELFEHALELNPGDSVIEKYLFAVKSYTDVSLNFDARYAQERERAQPHDQIAVQIDSFRVSETVYLPLTSGYRAFAELGYGLQKERNRIIGRNNYDVQIRSLELGMESPLGEFWTVVTSARIKKAEPRSGTIFPFQRETKFEPRLVFRHSSEKHFALLSGYLDSFIAKDFSQTRSGLLERSQLVSTYEYRLKPHRALGILGQVASYNDSYDNEEAGGSVWFRSGIPGLENLFDFRYQVDYREFKDDVPEYYSFESQVTNSLRLGFHHDWPRAARFELAYRHAWHTTDERVNPDQRHTAVSAVTLPRTTREREESNKVEALFRKRFGTSALCQLSGSYYWDTNSYEAWSSGTAFLWQF